MIANSKNENMSFLIQGKESQLRGNTIFNNFIELFFLVNILDPVLRNPRRDLQGAPQSKIQALRRKQEEEEKNVKLLNETRHDKTNKMSVRPAKTQISLGIRPD